MRKSSHQKTLVSCLETMHFTPTCTIAISVKLQYHDNSRTGKRSLALFYRESLEMYIMHHQLLVENKFLAHCTMTDSKLVCWIKVHRQWFGSCSIHTYSMPHLCRWRPHATQQPDEHTSVHAVIISLPYLLYIVLLEWFKHLNKPAQSANRRSRYMSRRQASCVKVVLPNKTLRLYLVCVLFLPSRTADVDSKGSLLA